MWRMGLFHVGPDHVPPSLDGLRDGLKALGYEEGKNIHFDWRNLIDENAARTTAQAFVRDRVDLIVAFENQSVRAIHAITTQIPVVMLHVPDPVADGFVRSLAHPGGNITGFAGLGNAPAKELEIFKEVVPQLRRPLVLFVAPLAAEAQQPERTYRIAHIYAGPRSGNQAWLDLFQQGMRELGETPG